MGKYSSSGPDETDVMALMIALGTIHSGRVEVIMSPDGLGFTPKIEVTCRVTFDVLPGGALPRTVEVKNGWPCNAHRTMWAHVYDGLHRLDVAVQHAYEQERLRGA